MYEPAIQAQVQAQAQALAESVNGASSHTRATSAAPVYSQGEGERRPAEQRLQEVSAAVGGTLNALGGKLGLGLSRFVNAATSATTGGPSTSAVPISSSAIAASNHSASPPYPQPTSSSSPSGRTSAAVRSLFDFDTSEPLSLARISSAPSVESEKARKQPLRRATFVLPSLSIVYPISTYGEPWSVKVMEDRKKVRRFCIWGMIYSLQEGRAMLGRADRRCVDGDMGHPNQRCWKGDVIRA